jgi:hypothetical protein
MGAEWVKLDAPCLPTTSTGMSRRRADEGACEGEQTSPVFDLNRLADIGKLGGRRMKQVIALAAAARTLAPLAKVRRCLPGPPRGYLLAFLSSTARR